MWNPSALHARVPHVIDKWNSGLNHLYGTLAKNEDAKEVIDTFVLH
jgi:hypothetical protein